MNSDLNPFMDGGIGIEDFIKNIPQTTLKADPLAAEKKLSPIKPKTDQTENKTKYVNLEETKYDYDDIPTRDDSFAKGKNPFATQNQNRPPLKGAELTYGQRKRRHGMDGDVVDKCHDLETENLALKEKENLLEREVLKMQTKLRRIEELMKSKKTFSDGDFSRFQRELEEQFGEIQDENTVLSERVKKLKIIHQHLTTKGTKTVDLTHKTSKKTYQVVGGGNLFGTQSKTSNKVYPYIPGQKAPQHMELIEELKIQLIKNQKEIIKLQAEKQRIAHMTSGHVTVDDLMRKINERESEIRDIKRKYDELDQQFLKKESIFKDSRTYIESIAKEIAEIRGQNQLLSMKNNKLQMIASQTRVLNDQLKDIQNERDLLEKQITTITSEPFFNREKGQSTLQRIAELKEKLQEKDKNARAIRDEEAFKTKELADFRPEVEKLRGEKEYLEKESKQLKDKFSVENKVDEFNVIKTLFQLDPKKYAQTMQDLSGKPEKYPIWSDMEFLERDPHPLSNDDLRGLKLEINKLRHENKDLAAELEKSQKLFKLQEDIERDSTKFFEQEQSRMLMMEKSTALKAEELARRADEKQRQISEITKKMGLGMSSKNVSPIKGGLQDIRKSLNDIYETQSEFSVMTNESEIKSDENVMDFVVQDAEYYYEAFKAVLDEREMMLHQKTLITFVTVDFYNHDTETSQIAEGYRPIYNTQFSFKNKVDDFYVQFLQKNVMRLDIYISKNNAAIHLGHAEVFLREIVERENVMQELSVKPPLIQSTIRIFGARGNSDEPIGSLRFKMRMRKPISEAIRFYRDRNEIKNMEVTGKDVFLESGLNVRNRKKVITIQIVGCRDIKVKYSAVNNMIQPFFYYQFYTFDERYSMTGAGPNPTFEDTKSFEVELDAKLITYLQREPLEIILFDDAAPVTGVERGGRADKESEQVDDMIGSVKISLEPLIKGSGVIDMFAIRNTKGETMGHLEAKISIIDVEGGFSSIANKDFQNELATMHYNKKWEQEFIYRIARKLAKFPGDVDLLFGIFARGQNSVTKEDFKYTCMKRLQLKQEISEREIDMFLRSCPVLLDKNIMDVDDFVQIFAQAITQARQDYQNEEAMQYTTIKKYENTTMTQNKIPSSRSNLGTIVEGTYSHQTSNYADTLANPISFKEQEILDILAKTRYGSFTLMKEKIKKFSASGYILSTDLIKILSHDGGLGDFEAKRVAQFFEVKSNILVAKFEEFLNRAIQIANVNSEAFKKFISLIMSEKVDMLVQKFISLDYNKDGSLNSDGFEAALLSYEFNYFTKEQAIEVFTIVSIDNMFHYRSFVMEHNPRAKISIMSRQPTPVPDTLISGRGTTLMQPSHDTIIESQSTTLVGGAMYEDPRLRIIKNKLKNYITHEDITLSSLFHLLDQNTNGVISQNEFLSKMISLKTPLDIDELKHLYSVLDKTSKNNITYQQFVMEFPEINVSYMTKKIKKIIDGAGSSYEKVFSQYCSNKQTMRMSESEFKDFTKKYITKAVDYEIQSLFRHFTYGLKDFITLEDFKQAFGAEVQDQVFRIGIEDIIKPLQGKLTAFGKHPSILFDNYDQNKNSRLSAEELADALKKDFNITLLDDEIQTFKDYFKTHYKTTEIHKLDFLKLLATKFERKVDQEQARKALVLLKEKLDLIRQTPYQVLSDFDSEKTGHLTLRNFKLGLNKMRVLSEFQIHNLAKFLDKQDDGFISIRELDVAIRQAPVPLSSTGSFSQMDKKNLEKWKKQDSKTGKF